MRLLYIKLFEGHAKDNVSGLALISGGGEVDFIAQIQVEQHTSPSGVDAIASIVISNAAGGGKTCLWDPLSILIQVYIDLFPWIKIGIEREVDPPSSTAAGHKLASVDINTRRISPQTKLAGVEQFVVRDHGVR